MADNKIVSLILTPFHYLMLKTLKEKHLSFNQWTVFVPVSLKSQIELSDDFEYVFIEENDFRIFSILKKPILIGDYRKKIVSFQLLLKEVVCVDSRMISVLIFNEKSIYAQIIISVLSREKRLDKLALCDEGMALYIKDSFVDKLKKIIYPILSGLILSFRYQYFRRAGVHRLIDIIYIRYPNLLLKEMNGVKYIKVGTGIKEKTYFPKADILFISSPLSEYGILGKKKESEMFAEILNIFIERNLKVKVKLHPKESLNKLSQFEDSIEILSRDILFEDMDVSGCDFVVSFGSSAILDMLNEGYPPDRIITLPVAKVDKSLLGMVNSISRVEELNKIFDKRETKA